LGNFTMAGPLPMWGRRAVENPGSHPQRQQFLQSQFGADSFLPCLLFSGAGGERRDHDRDYRRAGQACAPALFPQCRCPTQDSFAGVGVFVRSAKILGESLRQGFSIGGSRWRILPLIRQSREWVVHPAVFS